MPTLTREPAEAHGRRSHRLTTYLARILRPGRAASSTRGRPPSLNRPFVARYGLMLVAVLAALTIRVALEPIVGPSSRFMIFLPALMFSVWFGGLGPGVVGLLLSVALGSLLILPPFNSFAISNPSDLVGLVIYVFASTIVIGVQWRQQVASAREVTALRDTFEEQLRRRAAESSLRGATRQLNLLIEGVTDYAMYMVDPAGLIVTWNRGAERIQGWRADEILGKHLSVLYPPEDAAAGRPLRTLDEALRNGRYEEVAMRRRKDGSLFTADALVTPVYEDGELRGFIKIIRDMSEREESMRQLAAAHSTAEIERRRLEAVLQALPVGVCILNREGRVVRSNPAIARICGDPSIAERIASCGADLSSPSGPDHTFRPDEWGLGRALHKGEASGGEVLEIERPGGAPASILTSAAPVRDHSGEIVGAVAAIMDISELRRAQQKVRALNESLERRVRERTTQLQEANEQLEAFAHSASHDLRAPLRNVLAYSRLLLSEAQSLTDRERGYAQRIGAAAERMDGLIVDLLEYAQVSRVELDTRPVNLGQVVAEALPLAGAAYESGDARLTVERPLPPVIAHAPTLAQIFTNLLANAAKFVRPGEHPEVTLCATAEGDMVRIEVRDNGIGIAEADQGRIFNPFERLHGHDSYPGSGIGLAIVKKGVERMGGRVGLRSSPGNGSVFWFTLPAVKETAAANGHASGSDGVPGAWTARGSDSVRT